MSSLLVLGGTGFFGKSVLDLFNRGGLSEYGINKILIAARNTSNFPLQFPELMSKSVALVSLDISTTKTMPPADLVIHAASSTDARDYLADPSGQRANIEKAISNYCYLAESFHRTSRMVYCSSGAVYGQQPKNVELMDEDFPFQDVAGMVPHKRDYALGKRWAESEVMKLGKKGLNVSIARCFAFYGRYLPTDQHFAYGNFLGAALRGESIKVNASHRVVRSYMHADDLVHSLIRIALASGPDCPVYNVGSSEPIEIRDLAKQIALDYNVPLVCNEIKSQDDDLYVPQTNRLKQLNNEFNKLPS